MWTPPQSIPVKNKTHENDYCYFASALPFGNGIDNISGNDDAWRVTSPSPPPLPSANSHFHPHTPSLLLNHRHPHHHHGADILLSPPPPPPRPEINLAVPILNPPNNNHRHLLLREGPSSPNQPLRTILHMRPPQGPNDIDPTRRNNVITPVPIFILPGEVEESKNHKDGGDKEKVPPSPLKRKRDNITSYK
jgi:hypothetical protein